MAVKDTKLRDAERLLIGRLAEEIGYLVRVRESDEGTELIVHLSSGQVRLPLSEKPKGFDPFYGRLDPEGQEAAYERIISHVNRARF